MIGFTALAMLATLSAAADIDVTAAKAASPQCVARPDEEKPPAVLATGHEPSAVESERRCPTRGSILPALYVSLAGLNAFDAYSTSLGLARGARESNPLMRSIAGHPVALWAVKGGVTAVSIGVAERLWRRHRRAEAIATTIIANGVMAVVAAKNRSVLRRTAPAH